MTKTSKITASVLAVFIASCLAVFVWADLDADVFGFAWSENIGWVSFDSDSDGSPIDYGVVVDLSVGSGKFSGYAWSEHIGWISFNESDLSGCPVEPCRAEVSAPGQIGKENVYLRGWARALAHADGWDGWIRFDHGQANEPYIDTDGNFHGWAWGDDVIGWLSFNGADVGAGGNYKVIIEVNHPPTASTLEVSMGDYCVNPSHFFSWVYSDPDGDTESQFQFQADNDDNFSSPEVDRTESGLANPSPTTNNQTIIVAVSPGADQLGYNATYHWRVKVWDSKGADSEWINGPLFTTEKHRYPTIDFSWSPESPSEDEDVAFTDQSAVYGGANKSAWLWTFEDGNPASSAQENQTIQFTDNGSKQVSLQVTDSDNYSCSGSKSVNVKFKLPNWKEILPW